MDLDQVLCFSFLLVGLAGKRGLERPVAFPHGDNRKGVDLPTIWGETTAELLVT